MNILTPPDVAQLLGISEWSVNDLARRYAKGDHKGLPGSKVLRAWRFTEDDVTRFLVANRAAPPPVEGWVTRRKR